jgi:hypothetical protein
VGQGDLFEDSFFCKRVEAAEKLAVGGIDGFDGHAEYEVY